MWFYWANHLYHFHDVNRQNIYTRHFKLGEILSCAINNNNIWTCVTKECQTLLQFTTPQCISLQTQSTRPQMMLAESLLSGGGSFRTTGLTGEHQVSLFTGERWTQITVRDDGNEMSWLKITYENAIRFWTAILYGFGKVYIKCTVAMYCNFLKYFWSRLRRTVIIVPPSKKQPL